MKSLKIIALTTLVSLVSSLSSLAQCAMCRATLETNVSNGAETELSANLNFGILYLFLAPYIIIAAVGIFWYRRSQQNKAQV
jgi:hypothetical protein